MRKTAWTTATGPSYTAMARYCVGTDLQVDHRCFVRKWHFSKDEIEYHSPSRKDGIRYEEESHLRKLYCLYLQELGMNLKVPQVTIATAMLFCHRFYMRQSHATNDWQTVATACMFLASKAEETPRCLSDLVVIAYKLMYKWDPLAPQRIRQKEIYDAQKDITRQAEILLLATLAFDLNVEHPYKPLVAAVKELGLVEKDIMKVAWNFVNDWLRTTMCLQYKPHYIAAGSLFLAAKLQKVKLPSTKGNVWWMQFDVSPKQLEVVIQQMLKVLDQNKKQVSHTTKQKVPESKNSNGSEVLSTPESCVSNGSVVNPECRNASDVEAEGAFPPAVSACLQEKLSVNNCDNVETKWCPKSDSNSSNSTAKDVVFPLREGESDQRTVCRMASVEASNLKIDLVGIRERLKKRKLDRQIEKGSNAGVYDDIDSESWIERELENGIRKTCGPTDKRIRIGKTEVLT